MKVETANQPLSREFIALRSRSVEGLPVFPQVLQFLKNARLMELGQLIDTPLVSLCEQLQIQEEVGQYLYQQLDNLLEDGEPVFVCAMLPSSCFNLPITELNLPESILALLQQRYIQTLDQLASLERGRGSSHIELITQAFAQFVRAYRTQGRKKNISPALTLAPAKPKDSAEPKAPAKPSPEVALSPRLMEPLAEPAADERHAIAMLDLPLHLISYLQAIGIESVEQIADLPYPQMKLVLGLDDDAVDFLYAALRQHFGQSEQPLAEPKSTSPGHNGHEDIARPSALEDQPGGVRLPVFHKFAQPGPAASAPPVTPMAFPVLTEDAMVEILQSMDLLDSDVTNPHMPFDVMARQLLVLWDVRLNEIPFFSRQNVDLRSLDIHTFGQLLEVIMEQNLLWLKESSLTQSSTPPSLSITPLLIYIKQMYENQGHFLQESLMDRVAQGFLRFFHRFIPRQK